MTWCPKCRKEFSEESTTCADCGGDLLMESPTEEELMMDVEWVPVARDLEPLRARFLKDELESAGIPVVITGAALESFHIYPSVENAVLVPRRWSEDALEIVEDFLAEDVPDADALACSNCGEAVPPDAEVCPACGEPFDDEE